MASSDYILGRQINRKRFKRGDTVLVNCYAIGSGKAATRWRRYTDHVESNTDPKPSVLYRVRVRPKRRRRRS